MKKLRITNNKTFYFHIIKKIDSNGNTYQAFNQGYQINKGQREYFTDLNIKGFEVNKSQYGYEDAYVLVKEWINENTSTKISYISDYPNIIVSSEYLTNKEFNRLTK